MSSSATHPKEHDYKNGVKPLPLDSTLWSQLDEEDFRFARASISSDEAVIRRKADEIQKDALFPYPCIRLYHFIKLFAITNPIYPAVVDAGKKGDTIYLDLGCCMGTDVRKLVSDGYPAQNVYGCDLRREFIDAGFKLYNDAATCRINFFTSNAFDIPYPPPATRPLPHAVTELAQLQGHVTHLYTGALFHLFDEEGQYNLAYRLASLLKRVPGATIYGRQTGIRQALAIPEMSNNYMHSTETWIAMWKKVFSEMVSPEYMEGHVLLEAKYAAPFRKVDVVALDTKGVELLQIFWSVQLA